MTELKAPPHSQESEHAIIAAILQKGKTEQAVRECLDIITPDMFYFHSNREIFQTCLDLPVVDFGLVIDNLKNKADRKGEKFDYNEVVQYKRSYSSLQNLASHSDNLIKAYTQRQLAFIAIEMSTQAMGKQEPSDIINYLTEQLAALDMPSAYKPRHVYDCLKAHFDVIQKRAEGDTSVQRIKTGITDLDKQIGGFGSSWLVVIAGRPSHGKSLIAQIIGNHISRSRATAFFSMEMEESELMDRLITLETGASIKEVQSGEFKEENFLKFGTLLSDAKSKNFNQFIDTTPQLSLQQIRARVKTFAKQNPGAGLIQIDYLGLMKKGKSERNDLAVGEITAGLKTLAKEVQIPIVLLVQCNRGADTVKRMQNSNLADAAAIERDADLVMFTHREEVADVNTHRKGIIEFYPGKYRHGDFQHDIFLEKNTVTGKFECVTEAAIDFNKPTKRYAKKGLDL